MKRICISPVIHSRYRRSDGTISVKFRVSFGSEHKLFNSGINVSEADLVPLKKSEDGGPREIRNVAKKRRVEDLLRTYEDAALHFNSAILQDESVEDIYQLIVNKMKSDYFRLDFVEYAKKCIAKKEKSSHQAALNFKAAVYHLQEFFLDGNIENQKELRIKVNKLKKEKDIKEELERQMHRREMVESFSFDISRITSVQIKAFIERMKEVYGEESRSTSLYYYAIAAIHREARNEYNCPENEFEVIKDSFRYITPPKLPDPHHRNINKEIVQDMINRFPSLSGRQRIAVGSFLISFATMGMNLPDLYECRFLNRSKCVFAYDRVKTRGRRWDKAHMEIKIPEVASALFNEFLDKTQKDINGRVFKYHIMYSSLSTLRTAVSVGLKNYEKAYGGGRKFTFYSARHTWATIARSSECNITASMIDECLDHAGNTKMGDRYAIKDYSIYWQANESVLSRLDWTPICK